MMLLHSPEELMTLRKTQEFSMKTIGFVPTMGALHQGHAELLRKARKENDIVILSIFVNPTQFNDPNDFSKYPKTFEDDLKIAKEMVVDFIFAPAEKQMYPDDYRYRMSENSFSRELCGAHRPGHFDGVLTIVMKLLMLVKPTRVYFGEKDYQQLSLIRDMAQAFFLGTEIVPVPTVREQSGLAMSSRNQRLTDEQRAMASQIYKISCATHNSEEVKNKLSELGFQVDYVEDRKNRRFVAAKLGDVRLIDNVEI